jgi:hypothetical protein
LNQKSLAIIRSPRFVKVNPVAPSMPPEHFDAIRAVDKRDGFIFYKFVGTKAARGREFPD